LMVKSRRFLSSSRGPFSPTGPRGGAAEILEMFVGQKDKLMGDSQQNTDTKTDLL